MKGTDLYKSSKKFALVNIRSGFTDGKVALTHEKYLDAHLAVLTRFEYFKMIAERNNFPDLPAEKRIFSFPEYTEQAINHVIELIYYEEPSIENVETYREVRKLCDFLGLLKDEIVDHYITKYTKKFKCEWELYDLGGRQDSNIIINKKETGLYKMISESTCIEIVCISDDTEFLSEINKLLIYKMALTSNRNKLLAITSIILSVRLLLFHEKFHGIYQGVQSYILHNININLRAPRDIFLKICNCSACHKDGISIPSSEQGLELYKNVLIASAFKLDINNKKLNNYISRITEKKKKVVVVEEEDEEGEDEDDYLDDLYDDLPSENDPEL